MNEERLPPQDILAERCLLTGMVQYDTIFYYSIDNVIPEYFYHSTHRKIFEVFLKIKKRSEFLLQKCLEEDPELDVTDFLNLSHSIDCKQEIESIIECYHAREAINQCDAAKAAYFQPSEYKPTETTSNLICGLSGLYSKRNEVVRFGELLSAEFDRMEKVFNSGTAAYIKTGLSTLDEKLTIIKSDYVIIGARPSNCKSTLAGLIGRNVAKAGKTVLVFYLDTAKEVEISRALFTEARFDLNKFNRGFIPRSSAPKLAAAAGPLAELNYFIDDTPRITPAKIFAKAQRIKHEIGSLDLIIVDFIQNVYFKERDERLKINAISSELHNLPRDIGCPVIALSQMARYNGEEETPPQLYHLKESGNLEQDADIVLLLYRPGKYKNFETGDDRKTLLQVFVSKNKNGPVGYVPLNFIEEYSLITDRIENDQLPEPSIFQTGGE